MPDVERNQAHAFLARIIWIELFYLCYSKHTNKLPHRQIGAAKHGTGFAHTGAEEEESDMAEKNVVKGSGLGVAHYCHCERSAAVSPFKTVTTHET